MPRRLQSDGMSEKIKERMVNAQSSLRINNMIDVLMGLRRSVTLSG